MVIESGSYKMGYWNDLAWIGFMAFRAQEVSACWFRKNKNLHVTWVHLSSLNLIIIIIHTYKCTRFFCLKPTDSFDSSLQYSGYLWCLCAWPENSFEMTDNQTSHPISNCTYIPPDYFTIQSWVYVYITSVSCYMHTISLEGNNFIM